MTAIGFRMRHSIASIAGSVATGVVVDQATGYPGYNSIIPRNAVAIGEILRQNGYDTSW